MSIKSICKTKIVTVGKNSTLKDVAAVMQMHHVGCVIVTEGMDGKRIPAGIITDRDIAMAVGASLKPQDIRVDQVMQSHPMTINADDGIFETVLRMKDMGVKRLPVVNTDGSLFGLISSEDLLSLMAEEINNLAKISEVQIKNEKGVRMPKESHIEI